MVTVKTDTTHKALNTCQARHKRSINSGCQQQWPMTALFPNCQLWCYERHMVYRMTLLEAQGMPGGLGAVLYCYLILCGLRQFTPLQVSPLTQATLGALLQGHLCPWLQGIIILFTKNHSKAKQLQSTSTQYTSSSLICSPEVACGFHSTSSLGRIRS